MMNVFILIEVGFSGLPQLILGWEMTWVRIGGRIYARLISDIQSSFGGFLPSFSKAQVFLMLHCNFLCSPGLQINSWCLKLWQSSPVMK